MALPMGAFCGCADKQDREETSDITSQARQPGWLGNTTGVSLVLAALFAPCHSVALPLAIGLGLSGSSSVVVGLYGTLALAAAASVTNLTALYHGHKRTAKFAWFIGAASLIATVVQYADPPSEQVIEVAKATGTQYDTAAQLYGALCGQGRQP